MNMTITRRRPLLAGCLALGAAATVAACGSSHPRSTEAQPSSVSVAPPTGAAVTVSTSTVGGVGTVLVDSQGRTLYLLTSEQGGKITCTPANGCTAAWPETVLPAGTTAARAGSGVQASLLGTVKDASGNLQVTYNQWPLYTFAGDKSAGAANGQGLSSFGGTWYVLNSSGNPMTSGQPQPAGPSSSPAAPNGY